MNNPQALWTSFDGTHLMYATFNDTNVGTLIFPWFTTGTVLAAAGAAQRAPSFPSSKSVRYPTVRLYTYHLLNFTIR